MIKGDLKILYIKISAVWVPVGCLTSNGFEESVEQIVTTTRDNADGWGSFIPGGQTYSIPFAGIQMDSNLDMTKVSYDRLKLLKRSRTLIEWKLEDIVNSFIDYGEGYIVAISETADQGDFLSFEGTIQGVGTPINFIDTEAPTAPFQNLFTAETAEYVGLSWVASTDNVGVTGYKIYQQKDAETTTVIATVSSDTLTYDDYSVISGSVYGYWISAIDGAGNESPLSNKRLTSVIPSQGAGNDNFIFQDANTVLYQGGVSSLI